MVAKTHNPYNFGRFSLLTAVILGAAVCGWLATTQWTLALGIVGGILAILLLQYGRKDIASGLAISIAIMNNGYDLLPYELLNNSFIKKTWDFGFLYMLIVTAKYLPSIFSIKGRKYPLFLKFFYIFLLVVILSFILSLVKLPYPYIDIIRSFRTYMGYLLIPILILIFDKKISKDVSIDFNKFIKITSFICFILLLLYNIQFIIQHQFFFGYDGIHRFSDKAYIRSMPSFLLFSYYFFWLYVAEWMKGLRLSIWKIIYIIMSLSSVLFTFSRGIYLSIGFLLLLLCCFMISIRSFNRARLSLITFALPFAVVALFLSSLVDPFYDRLLSSFTDIQEIERNNNVNYRIQLVKDRVRIIRDNNLMTGVGFVHPKYAYYDYGPFVGNHLPGEVPSIWCADIAWGNIIYQTGLLGVLAFTAFIIVLIKFCITQLGTYRGELLFFQLASCFELLRNIILMFNGSSFTYQTQNVAMFLGISAYLHIIHCRRLQGP